MKSVIKTVAILSLVVIWGVGAAYAGGNRELMSVKMAKQDLTRNLVESVIGYKVKSEGQFGLTEDANYNVKAKASAVIKGVVVDKVVYDREKDVAVAIGHIDLGSVINIIGDRKRYAGVTVFSIGLGTMTEATRPALMALRAALLNAYDEMAATIVGQRISSYSEMENFILTEDSNKSAVCAAVYGAYIPDVDLNSSTRGWGWDETGNAFVVLELDLRKVRDILGQRIIYTGGENIIRVTGHGATVDDLHPQEAGTPGMVRPPGPQVEYGTLPIPTGEQDELKGAPAQELTPEQFKQQGQGSQLRP